MKKLFIAFIAFHLVSCSNFKTDKVALVGSWRLHNVTSDSKKQDFDREAKSMQTVSEGAFLNLFSDSTYSYMTGKGDYQNGKWNFEEDANLAFLSSRGASRDVKFKISTNPNKVAELELVDVNTGTASKYSKEAEPLDVVADDPFHPFNNLWRIKPAGPESKEKLKERLANYFKHFALILKAAKDRKLEVVYFGLSLGPIRVYNGGIGIIPINKVPDVWKNTYYDDADAATAYHMFDKVLSQSTYHGASVGNWVEDDYKILQALYQEIKQMKE